MIKEKKTVMTIPKVGFDIDGVVANIYPVWLAFIANEYNVIAPSVEDVKEYGMWKFFDPQLTSNQVSRLLGEVFKQVNLIEPYYDSIEFIKWYDNRYLEDDEFIYFITARRESEAKGFTEAWLKRWLLHVNFKVIYAKKSEKYKFIEDNLDAFVETYSIVINCRHKIEVYLV